MNAVVGSSFNEVIQVIIPTSKAHMAHSIRDAIHARLDAQGRPLIAQSDITFTNAPTATGIRFQYSVELEVKSMLGHHTHRQAIENTYYTDDVDVFLGKREGVLAQFSKNFINGLYSQIEDLNDRADVPSVHVVSDIHETLWRFRDVFPRLESQSLQ